jgi:hypothetical protein
VDNHWEWKSGHEVHTGTNFTREGLLTPFEIAPGVFVPPGTYDHAEAQIVAFTNEGAPFGVRTRIVAGGFFGGHRLSTEHTLRMRIGEQLTTEAVWSRNDVDLPWGDFITNLVRTRASYSFSPRAFVQALVQYNDRDQIWSSNLRFGWIQRANTGLFVVYNDTQNLDDLRPSLVGRSVIVKYTRLFDVLR